MVTYSTTMKSLPRVLRALVQTDVEAAVRAARLTAFVDAHRWIEWSIRSTDSKRRPVDTGDYRRAWAAEPTPAGAIFYSTASPAVKAGVIERGRRAGKGIPLEPLAEWVRRRLHVRDRANARSIAFLISRKHRREGRKGLGVMKRAHPKIAEAFRQNLLKELRRSQLAREVAK